MAIKEDNARVVANMSKIERDKLKKLAKADNRSVSSYIRNLVIKEIQKSEE